MTIRRVIAVLVVVLLVLGAVVFFLPILLDEHGFVPEETADLMRAELRGLAGRQDEYFAAHGTYSDTLTRRSSYDEDIRFTIVEATRTGWSATATHPRMQRWTCAIFAGDARPPLTEVGTAGEPACGQLAER